LFVDDFSQNHNAMLNGYYAPKQTPTTNQVKRSAKANTDTNTLLTTAPVSNQQIPSNVSKRKDGQTTENGAEPNENDSGSGDDDDEDDDDDDEDDDEDAEDEENENTDDSDDGSSDRFSIKSDLARINEESSKIRQTPQLYARPHLRARFAFNQLIQVLPQSPSDTNQPATVEIISADVKKLVAYYRCMRRMFL
jgi:cobalamin biosynthesis protein CobT